MTQQPSSVVLAARTPTAHMAPVAAASSPAPSAPVGAPVAAAVASPPLVPLDSPAPPISPSTPSPLDDLSSSFVEVFPFPFH